jgi:hypothetical protein
MDTRGFDSFYTTNNTLSVQNLRFNLVEKFRYKIEIFNVFNVITEYQLSLNEMKSILVRFFLGIFFQFPVNLLSTTELNSTAYLDVNEMTISLNDLEDLMS